MPKPELDRQSNVDNRDSTVEVIRLFSCVIVVCYHLVWAFAPASVFGSQSPHFLSQHPFGNPSLLNFLPFDLLMAGNCAVSMFFVISGYVLAIQYFRSSKIRVTSFIADLVKRYARLALPLYVFVTLSFLCFKFNLYDHYACAAANLSGSKGLLLCCGNRAEAMQAFLTALIFPFKDSPRVLAPTWTVGVELVGSYFTYALAAVMASFPAGMLVGVIALFVAPGYTKLFVVGTLFAFTETRGVLNFQTLRQKLGKLYLAFGGLLIALCLYVDAFPWVASGTEVQRFAPCFTPLVDLNLSLLGLKIDGGITALTATLTFFACKLYVPKNRLVEAIAELGKHTYVFYLSHMIILGTICSAVFVGVLDNHIAGGDIALACAAVAMFGTSIVVCFLSTDLVDGNAVKLSRWLKSRCVALFGKTASRANAVPAPGVEVGAGTRGGR